MMISINPKRVVLLLAFIAMFLAFAGLFGQCVRYVAGFNNPWGLVRIFDLDVEESVPTWFSSLLLLLAAAQLFLIGRVQRREGEAWLGLSLIFFCLSLEEVAASHEGLNSLRATLAVTGIDDYLLIPLGHPWVLFGGLFVGAVGIVYSRFLLRLPPGTRWLFAASAIVYVGGAIGLDMVGAGHAALHGDKNLAFALLSVIEETLEMAGVLLFNFALANYIAQNLGGVTLRIEGDATESEAAGNVVPLRRRESAAIAAHDLPSTS